MMNRLIFAFMGAPGPLTTQALILARSIRAFAGELSQNPVWILVPSINGEIPEYIQSELISLDVRIIPFAIDQEALEFPFAAKVYASATAESIAKEQKGNLVWMDSGSIVIREPNDLLLSTGKYLGYRPVDHTLIGSPYDEPIDLFWELIYLDCNVPEDRLFQMTASVDQKVIRPYFNAGMLVVRPENGLLQAWRDNFHRLYHEPSYVEFYRQNILYKIFIHQAVLSGTILSTMKRQELYELPHLVNYPLHMHRDYLAAQQPENLNELVTCRYEVFFDDPDWRENIKIKEPLKSWLENQVRLLDAAVTLDSPPTPLSVKTHF